LAAVIILSSPLKSPPARLNRPRAGIKRFSHNVDIPSERHHQQLENQETSFRMADAMSKRAELDTEALEGEKINSVYREGAIAGEGGETKRGLKSRHIQFL
jgi:hypothetical protein